MDNGKSKNTTHWKAAYYNAKNKIKNHVNTCVSNAVNSHAFDVFLEDIIVELTSDSPFPQEANYTNEPEASVDHSLYEKAAQIQNET